MTPDEILRVRALEAHAQRARAAGTEDAAREALAAYARMLQIMRGEGDA